MKIGTVAECSLGALGLITSSTRREVTYRDGKKAKVWVGIHLTNKIAAIGSPWSSRNPTVYGLLGVILEKAQQYEDLNS